MNKKLVRKGKGFSLVEILFVVIIIGVLTAVAVPSLFSQKGKADDSNAKQTLKVVEQLLTTTLQSDGSFPAPLSQGDGKTGSGPIQTANKNVLFNTDSSPSAVNGNVRSVSITGAGGTSITYVTALGGKNKANDGSINCWYIKVDPSGAAPTAYGLSKGTCSAQSVANTPGTEQDGDFPNG